MIIIDSFEQIAHKKKYLIIQQYGFELDSLFYTTEKNLQVLKKQWIFDNKEKFNIHDIISFHNKSEEFKMKNEIKYITLLGSDIKKEQFNKFTKISSIENFIESIKEEDSKVEDSDKNIFTIEDKYIHLVKKYDSKSLSFNVGGKHKREDKISA